MTPSHYLCEGCGSAVSPKSVTAHFEITGWVQRREGGGINHVEEQHQTGRVFCGPACWSEHQHPPSDQQTLL